MELEFQTYLEKAFNFQSLDTIFVFFFISKYQNEKLKTFWINFSVCSLFISLMVAQLVAGREKDFFVAHSNFYFWSKVL